MNNRVVQSGNVTPGHGTEWVSDGVVGDTGQPAIPSLLAINTQISSYTLALPDAGAIVEMNSPTANTLTIPNNSAVPYPVGTVIYVVQAGNGTTTVQGAAGVSLFGVGSLGGIWSEATLYQRTTNNWVIGSTTINVSPAGALYDVQYNNSGSFAGNSGLTFNGVETLTIGGGAGFLQTGFDIPTPISVSSLPLPSNFYKGARATVVDAQSVSFLGTLAAGGTIVAPVFCNGTNWLVG